MCKKQIEKFLQRAMCPSVPLRIFPAKIKEQYLFYCSHTRRRKTNFSRAHFPYINMGILDTEIIKPYLICKLQLFNLMANLLRK